MLNSIFIYISIGSSLLPIYFGLKSKSWTVGGIKFILFLAIVSFFLDIISLQLANKSINNMPVNHLWTIIESVLLLSFFSSIFNKAKQFIRAILFIFLAHYIISGLLNSKLFEFYTLGASIESFLMIIFSLIFFFRVYAKESTIFLERMPEFWIVVGVLVYFSGALFSFLLASDILSHSPNRFYNSWILHNSANILKNILFAIGLWKVRLVKA